MSDDVKALMQRFYDEVVNAGNPDLIDELLDESFVEHEELPGFSNDREGVKQFFAMMLEAFDGLRIDVDAIYAEGDTAIARMTSRGNHTGEFMGIPASGRDVAVSVIDIIRFADGKGVEHWGIFDGASMMQQMGAMPAEAPGG